MTITDYQPPVYALPQEQDEFEKKLSKLMGMTLDKSIMEGLQGVLEGYISLTEKAGDAICTLAEKMFKQFQSSTTMKMTEAMEVKVRWLFLQRATNFVFLKMETL